MADLEDELDTMMAEFEQSSEVCPNAPFSLSLTLALSSSVCL